MLSPVRARRLSRTIMLLFFALISLPGSEVQAQAITTQPKAASGPCGNPAADRLLQQGHSTWPTSGYGLPPVVARAGEALTYFRLAVAEDPKCAEAWVDLARAEIGFPSWPGLPPSVRFPQAQAAATRAIELQENSAEAHALLGSVDFNTGKWAPAEEEYRRAIALAPNSAAYHADYARFLAAMGHARQAVSEIEQARKLANGSPPMDVAAGEIYYWTRQYDKAITLIRAAAGANPSDGIVNFLLGWAYVGEKKWPDAAEAFQKAVPLTDRDAGDVMSLAYVYASDGQRNRVPPMLEEVEEKTSLMYVPVYRIAATYVALGDKEQALQWLQRAYSDDYGWMVWLKVDPVMDPLRSDPRFQNLLARMKFPQ